MRVWFFRAQHAAWWLLSCLAWASSWELGAFWLFRLPQGTQGHCRPHYSAGCRPRRPRPGRCERKGGLEKDIVLAIAQELERLLNKAAVSVIMVRHGDYDLADSRNAPAEPQTPRSGAQGVYCRTGTGRLYIHPCQLLPFTPMVRGPDLYDENQPESERLAKGYSSCSSGALGSQQTLGQSGQLPCSGTPPCLPLWWKWGSYPIPGKQSCWQIRNIRPRWQRPYSSDCVLTSTDTLQCRPGTELSRRVRCVNIS